MSENSQNEELREVSVATDDDTAEPTSAAEEEAPVSANVINQVDASHSVQDSNDVKVAEDGGREDMFVDCSDEIEESHQNEEEKSIVQETQSKQLNNEAEAQDLVAEVQNLRDELEKTVAEKLHVEQDYEEERAALKRELNYLHCQLKALNVQYSSFDGNHDRLVDHHHGHEIRHNDEKHMESVASLHEMINDCSKLLETSQDLHSQGKCSTRDPRTALQMKDVEIEELNSKIIESSVSQDVILSYLSSKHETFSHPSEVQLEKDQNIEEFLERILVLLPTTFHKKGFAEESIMEKYSHIEESIRILIAKHIEFLSEIQQLKCCLTEISSDVTLDDEVETFSAARGKLLELKRREVDLDQKLSHFETENRELAEHFNRNKGIIESTNAEIAKLNAELEQERTRYANTKEKLSLAVTKGKALVQHRDSLKQVLAEKTSELDRCLIEVQEKSAALEAAEQSKDLLVKCENFTASLQESLSERNSILQKCGELLSETAGSETIQSVEIIEKIRWLMDERNQLQSVALEFHKLSDILSSISFPEDVLSSELDTQLKWLLQSFHVAKEEALKLQDDTAEIREAACKEIDRMTASLLAETQEKDYLQEELQDLRSKYEAIVEKEYQVSAERDQFINMLLKASGITMDAQDEVNFCQHGISGIIEKCIKEIKEEAGKSLETSQDKVEYFERIQSLLYVRDQELMLYVNLMEEEMQDKTAVHQLSNELKIVNKALHTLKTEKDSLQKDLERSEEKAVLLREKLSMAVKKGKGLVQERENLKGMLEGKNTEIETLKSELQEQAVASSGLKDQVDRLLADIDRIPKLETDLIAIEERKSELEKFLFQSNSLLQRLIECIDSIDHPADMVFEEPVQKVKWLATCLNDCLAAEAQAQQELELVKHDANALVDKIKEAETSMNLMQKSLADSESKISQLLDEKRELEVAKIQSQEELQKAAEEASSLKSKFTEVSATMKLYEDALMSSEESISKLTNEKQDALVSKAAADMEIQKLKEENTIYVSKLAEVDKTIQSLEDAFFNVETKFSQLSEEHNKTLSVRSEKEDELNKLKGEADSLATKLADAFITIKSLEDALADAENNISDLDNANKTSEQEISALNSRLNACLQELAGAHGSVENRSHELFVQFSRLQLLLRDDTLLSLVQQNLEKKTESLNDMDHIFREIEENFSKIGSRLIQNYPVTEDDSSLLNLVPADLDDIQSLELANGDVNAADGDNIIQHFQGTIQKFHLRDKTLAKGIKNFSKFVDGLISVLLGKLRATKDGVTVTLELLKSLEQKVNKLEMDRLTQGNTIPVLENDIKTLLYACSNAIHELESQLEDDLLDFSSTPALRNFSENFSRELGAFDGDAVIEDELKFNGSKYEPTAKKLLFTARHSREQFQGIKKAVVQTIEGLHNELEETKMACKKFSEEKDVNQYQISKLEAELGVLQRLCNEIRLELEDYQDREAKWKEREVELSAAHATSVMKAHETQDFPLSISQIRALFDKISAIDLSFSESEVNDFETHGSFDVWKLFYIVDKFGGLSHQINSEAQERQNLQSKLEKQVLEIEYLKEEIAQHIREKQGIEKMRNELTLGLEDIVRKLGGDEVVGVHKAVNVMGLFPILEKMVLATRAESETLKSKTEELNKKLLGTQKVVDDLSSKLRLFEESNPAVANLPETVQEKGLFESSSLPTNSEISEIQDLGPTGKNTAVPPVPYAAHPRTLRKGSNDHLAIAVDPESQELINNEQADDDKGHVFKSLNTSGLIPRQGKIIADRVDGIWVSGDRALMRHPRARLSFIAYCLVLHIWLLGSVL